MGKKGFMMYIPTPEVKVDVVVYDDVFCLSSYHTLSEEYESRASVVKMGEREMKSLSVKEGDNVVVRNERGEIVVKVVDSSEDGYLIPRSPLTN